MAIDDLAAMAGMPDLRYAFELIDDAFDEARLCNRSLSIHGSKRFSCLAL
jgi:hypothetical protein